MTIREDVKQFVIENFLFGQDNGLRDDSSLMDLGIIDSTGILELVAFLEEHFGITVGDEDLVPESLDSISSIATFIERQMSATRGSA